MERRCAGVSNAAGLARGEMGEDPLDDLGSLDAGDMRRLLDDELRAETMYAALACGHPEAAFEGKELALLEYAGKHTVDVGAICRSGWPKA